MSTSAHLSSSSTLQEIDVLCSPRGYRPQEASSAAFSPALNDVTCGHSVSTLVHFPLSLCSLSHFTFTQIQRFKVKRDAPGSNNSPTFAVRGHMTPAPMLYLVFLHALLRFSPFISHLYATSFTFTSQVNKQLPSNLT